MACALPQNTVMTLVDTRGHVFQAILVSLLATHRRSELPQRSAQAEREERYGYAFAKLTRCPHIYVSHYEHKAEFTEPRNSVCTKTLRM